MTLSSSPSSSSPPPNGLQLCLSDFRIAFGLFDREGKGSITIDDLKAVLRSLGKNPADEELQDMIREVDDDGKGGGVFVTSCSIPLF